MTIQTGPDLAANGKTTAREILRRIRAESRDESEKGRWFEQLFMRIAKQEREFEIDGIWRWGDWPERIEATGLDGRDIGIDLVARRTTGEWVAIQCKCYDESRTIGKREIDKFLGGSQQRVFALRWVVATCRWGPLAEKAIQRAQPQVSQIDFGNYLDVQVAESESRRPVQEPWPLQAEAIEDVVEGLANHDRGRLVMACGTGKTFTSLRIAEQVVVDGGCILFVAPTIALVSQARREWLRQTTRPLTCIVVCSDATAGGRGESEDIRVSELECPVTTDARNIARVLRAKDGSIRVVFCTYQSLQKVTQAQAMYGAPKFDLAIADEAHRTTGVLRKRKSKDARSVDFQEFHDGGRLRACKRLYMTATPRIYTRRSKGKLASRGFDVVDMNDLGVYGPEFHRLPFAKAVHEDILSDYRVIVLGVNSGSVTPGLRRRLEALARSGDGRAAISTHEMTRVLGASLALNGVTEGAELEQPGKMSRALAFANSIARSKWYASALTESEVLRATTRRMEDGRAMKVVARHLDASASALERNQELRALAGADREGECRVVCNVKLFTEGVDVPSLDAVAFLDPRDSQVDVVQAVGRVMRKAPGKRFGYIVIPVIVDPGRDVADALERGSEGYKTVGRVLRALQSHDSRLAETPAKFVRVYGPGPRGPGPEPVIPEQLELEEAGRGIYAHVAAASGLGKPGQLVADEILDAVRFAGTRLQNEELEDPLAEALDLVSEDDGGAKGVCTIAALMIANACLLQRRLRDEPEMKTILRLDKVAGASNPGEVLSMAWEAILEKDYAPVFRPALAVLNALPNTKAVGDAIRVVAECANRVADSLSELGYDHSGPLYHRILGSAKSDGAFYTNNVSAILLARLALSDDFIDWSDPEEVAALRVIDPACGTGTLLMACIQTIKARVAQAMGDGKASEEDLNTLHKRIVEDVLCGLDINSHGVQLAACNMTLGAPTVDYERMNLVTMPHGPQGDGAVKAGSLEILMAADGTRELYLREVTPKRSLERLDGVQVNESEEIRFPLHGLDGVIMNPPFTDNIKRARKFGPETVKDMQDHELGIRDRLRWRDPEAGGVITSNSIQTFFTPLADLLVRRRTLGGGGGGGGKSFISMVLPVTACTGTAASRQRRFFSDRFHIERVVTTHDPKRPAFSENTGIHECLLICRRRSGYNRPPTQFVSLRRMPGDAREAIEIADAIVSGDLGDWGSQVAWPAERVRAGNWTPVQWYDGTLAVTARNIEASPFLEPLELRHAVGPAGRGIRGTYEECDPDDPEAVKLFWSISSKLRRTMCGEPEEWRRPKSGMEIPAARYWGLRDNVLVAGGINTVSGRLTALWTPSPSVGSGWMPVSVTDDLKQHGLVAWWNSTPVRLMLLNMRSKMLTYPKWSMAQLRQIRIPKRDNPAWDALADAWDRVRDLELLPMRQGEQCEARRVIDAAAAVALGVSDGAVADWRRRLAGEPTVSNAQAPPLGLEEKEVR